MYVGRDLTEQMVPYLNSQGQSIHLQIVKEIENRGGLKRNEADYTHSTEVSYD